MQDCLWVTKDSQGEIWGNTFAIAFLLGDKTHFYFVKLELLGFFFQCIVLYNTTWRFASGGLQNAAFQQMKKDMPLKSPKQDLKGVIMLITHCEDSSQLSHSPVFYLHGSGHGKRHTMLWGCHGMREIAKSQCSYHTVTVYSFYAMALNISPPSYASEAKLPIQ